MQSVQATPPVIVGVDGSTESQQALAWAMEFATTRKSPLLILTAYRDKGSSDLRYAPGVAASLEARSSALTGMYDQLTASGIDYQHVVSEESIGSLIRRHADQASVVVLGSGPRHRWHQRLRPSLARRLTGRIGCPVLAIPRSDAQTTIGQANDRTPVESHPTTVAADSLGHLVSA